MKTGSFHTEAPATYHCQYSNSYSPIYDSAYGTGFVFYDEEEFTEDYDPIGMGNISSFRSIDAQSKIISCQTVALKQSTLDHHH